jgi:hypothetical protein
MVFLRTGDGWPLPPGSSWRSLRSSDTPSPPYFFRFGDPIPAVRPNAVNLREKDVNYKEENRAGNGRGDKKKNL